jgi:hypothetical protein
MSAIHGPIKTTKTLLEILSISILERAHVPDFLLAEYAA